MMNNVDSAYLSLMQNILDNGDYKEDRTGTGTYSLFGQQVRYNFEDGFPILTSKKVHWKSVVHELLWMISGDSNIRYLVLNDVNIWNDWPYKEYCEKKGSIDPDLTIEEFIGAIKASSDFAKTWGNLGVVYGEAWRHFPGNSEGWDREFSIDQIDRVQNILRCDPDSRRMIVSAWHPQYVDDVPLPPCHLLWQLHCVKDLLSLQIYIRSNDMFLGHPFNLSSYALLLAMFAKAHGKRPHELIVTIGDAHIYANHVDQVKQQMEAETFDLPVLKLKDNIDNIIDFSFDDIELIDYKYSPAIKAPVAV